MSDATGSMPIVEQGVGYASGQVKKLLLRIEIGYHILSKKSIELTVSDDGRFLRFVYPRSELGNDLETFFEGLKRSLDARTAENYYQVFEQQTMKKRKTKKGTGTNNNEGPDGPSFLDEVTSLTNRDPRWWSANNQVNIPEETRSVFTEAERTLLDEPDNELHPIGKFFLLQ